MCNTKSFRLINNQYVDNTRFNSDLPIALSPNVNVCLYVYNAILTVMNPSMKTSGGLFLK